MGVWFFSTGKDEAILSSAVLYSAAKMVFISLLTFVYWVWCVPWHDRRREENAGRSVGGVVGEGVDSEEKSSLIGDGGREQGK